MPTRVISRSDCNEIMEVESTTRAELGSHSLVSVSSKSRDRSRARIEYKNESKASKKFNSYLSSSFPYTLNQPAGSKFIGSFIHEHSFDVRVKQRPSKRARQRLKKRLQKVELENEGNKTSPESGYDTTSGDCQTPGTASPEKGTFGTTDNQKNKAPGETNKRGDKLDKDRPFNKDNSLKSASKEAEKENRVHSRTTSASSIGSLNISDKSLKRLLKDLRRCEVSIMKYEALLSEKCGEGQNQLRGVFSSLRQDLDARENDLSNELAAVHEKAAAILQRRKNTALYLKQAADQLNSLEDAQVTELKQQIKQFVTERRVDEEIGTITRFQADPDDLLPHIMGFGKVNNVRHLYTEWEENPGEAIEMSKHRLSFSVSSLGQHCFSSSSLCDSTSSPSHSVNNDSDATDNPAFVELDAESPCVDNKSNDRDIKALVNDEKIRQTATLSKVTNEQKSPSSGSMVMDKLDEATNKSHQKIDYPTSTNEPSEETGESADKLKCSQGEDETESKEQMPSSIEKKLSPAELLLKQSRVRESLQMQGVFLYDPITGEGPPPLALCQATPSDMSTAVDYGRPISPLRKKKTPTQLRRERKKRQKERERRQNELERKLREESTKSNTSLSSDSMTPELPLSEKRTNASGCEEDATNEKKTWKQVTPDPSGNNYMDVSNESSDSETTNQFAKEDETNGTVIENTTGSSSPQTILSPNQMGTEDCTEKSFENMVVNTKLQPESPSQGLLNHISSHTQASTISSPHDELPVDTTGLADNHLTSTIQCAKETDSELVSADKTAVEQGAMITQFDTKDSSQEGLEFESQLDLLESSNKGEDTIHVHPQVEETAVQNKHFEDDSCLIETELEEHDAQQEAVLQSVVESELISSNRSSLNLLPDNKKHNDNCNFPVEQFCPDKLKYDRELCKTDISNKEPLITSLFLPHSKPRTLTEQEVKEINSSETPEISSREE